MTTITPCLWFNGDAVEAVRFYRTAFDSSAVHDIRYLPTEHSGESPVADDVPAQRVSTEDDAEAEAVRDVVAIEFEIAGQPIIALNGGERYGFNESISFMVSFDPSIDPDAAKNLDALWIALIDGGTASMPLDSYEFSSRYGWLRDRFGVHWQLNLVDPSGSPRPKVVPSLIFGSHVQNRAREAADFYSSLFDDTEAGVDIRFEKHSGAASAESVMFADFRLLNQWFIVMDATVKHRASFTEAFSFIVSCTDQAEIDRYWAALSADPDAERQGWCVDQFGLTWQVTPLNMAELMSRPGAIANMMGMKKLEIASL